MHLCRNGRGRFRDDPGKLLRRGPCLLHHEQLVGGRSQVVAPAVTSDAAGHTISWRKLRDIREKLIHDGSGLLDRTVETVQGKATPVAGIWQGGNARLIKVAGASRHHSRGVLTEAKKYGTEKNKPERGAGSALCQRHQPPFRGSGSGPQPVRDRTRKEPLAEILQTFMMSNNFYIFPAGAL